MNGEFQENMGRAAPRSGTSNGNGNSRGLFTQALTALLRPAAFFRSLPASSQTRQWLWVALIILALVGYSAVRQENAAETATEDSAADGGAVGVPGDVPIGEGPGGIPPGVDPGASGGETDAPADPAAVSADWSRALTSGSTMVLEWALLVFLLAEVSLLNSRRPRFGHNLQIAIWASVPLGLMAGVQIIYMLSGGKIGADGLSGLLPEWDGYQDLSQNEKSLVLSLASRITLFWFWTMALLYIGARRALNGKPLAIWFVLIGWMVVLTVVPVLTGDIEAEEVKNTTDAEEMPIDAPFFPEGEMPIDNTPIDNTPIDNMPIDNMPMEDLPSDLMPSDQTPLESESTETPSAEKTPASEVPSAEATLEATAEPQP